MDTFEEFKRHLRDALTHLYDPAYRPPELLWAVTGCDPQQGVEAVQAVIIQAIEDLKPAPDVREQAEQAIKEGAEKIMRALEFILHAVPQYEMPEVLDNGDIIIRRQNPDRPRHPGPSPRPRDGTDETST